LRAWLEGRAAAPGHAPVPLALPAPAPQPPTRNRHATAARTTKK